MNVIIEIKKRIKIDFVKIKVIINWKFKNLINIKVIKFFSKLYNFIKMFIYYFNEISKLLNYLFKKDALFKLEQKQ